MTIVLAQNAKSFEATNPMFNVNAHRGQPAILLPQLLTQDAATRFAMRREDPSCARVRQIPLFHSGGKLRRDSAAFVDPLISGWPPVAGIEGENLPAGIRGDLRLEGVALLFARVHASLPRLASGAWHAGLKGIDQHEVQLVGLPGRGVALPALLGSKTVGRTQITQ